MLKVKSNDKDMKKEFDTKLEQTINENVHILVEHAKSNDEIINDITELITSLMFVDDRDAKLDYITNKLKRIIERFDGTDQEGMIEKIVEFALECLQ